MTITDTDLQNRFTYHDSENDDQVVRYQKIRESGLTFSRILNELCPDSREKSLAITKLQEVVMWANASIACNTPSQRPETN